MTFIRAYSAPELSRKEILRYAGCKSETDLPEGFLEACLNEALPVFSYKVCYSVFDIKVKDDECDFSAFKVKSKDLAKNLGSAKNAVVFAATVGVGIDRLISKYGEISPSKAVTIAAIGAERIESLCNTFCEDIKREYKTELKPRFSPGYGDLSLSVQKDIFSVLNCQKHIGLTLVDSMLMSPTKSVTAIAGFTEKPQGNTKKCEICENKNCLYKAYTR